MKIDYNKALVTKSNSLIEASYRLSANEQKLILMLIASVKKEDKEFYPYTISAKKLANVLGLKNKNIYKDIEKLVLGLQRKTLILENPAEDTKNSGSTLNINWLSSSEYFHGEGRLELCIDPKLKPHLLNLQKCFTSYKFREIAQLKSRFTIRIYELLKQYQNFSSRVFSIEKLRQILDIEPTQYRPYFNFKNKVIFVAQKELAQKGSLTFDFEEIKEGRKVTKIRFIIKNQPIIDQISFQAIRDIEITDNEKILDLLPEQYKDKMSIKNLLNTYLEKNGYDYVARNIIYANDKSNAVNPGKNMSKRSNYRNYLKKALKDDFGLAYMEELEEKRRQEELRKKAEEKGKKEEEREKIAKQAKEKLDELIKNYIAGLSKNEYEKLESEALKILPEEQKVSVIKKKTGSNALLKLMIKKIVEKRILKDKI